MKSILPKAVRELARELTRLPGIGPKTAQRLALHLLKQPYALTSTLGNAIKNLHANVRTCNTCFMLAEEEYCAICTDPSRDTTLLCLVEDPLDIDALEKTDSYRGLYHVLGGVLSPMHGVGTDHLTLNELYARIERDQTKELIIALDHTLESEATSHYIMNHLQGKNITITRLARGLPTGGDIEFADALTLGAALSGRKTLQQPNTSV